MPRLRNTYWSIGQTRKVWRDFAMSRIMYHQKQASKRKRRSMAAPFLGVTGLSFRWRTERPRRPLGSVPDTLTRNAGASNEITLRKEEISDVSLAKFYVIEKEKAGTLPARLTSGTGRGLRWLQLLRRLLLHEQRCLSRHHVRSRQRAGTFRKSRNDVLRRKRRGDFITRA